jgi:uncharacterized membrane protein (DUF485 family)
MDQLKESSIVGEKNQPIDYEKIALSEEFKQLLLDKKKFILPYTLFYLAYSLILPFLAFYTDILNYRVIGDITLAWVYGVSIIVMSLWVCSVYVKKSAYFDEKVKGILEKEGM